MKRGIVKSLDKLIAAVLALLGVTATGCEERYLEYGSPHATFKIRGTVTQEATQEPVEGIRVLLGTTEHYYYDTLHTDAQGKYECVEGGVAMFDTTWVKVEDVDGAAHGGSFAADSAMLTPEQLVMTEEGEGWNIGTFEGTLDFSLKPQSEEQPAETPQP